MAVSYATVAQFTQVYSPKDISSSDLFNYWIPHGSLRVNEALGGLFATPFSNNNNTARDLAIHFGYLGLLIRTKREGDSKELTEWLDKRIADIKASNAPMILDDGSSLFASGTIGEVFSTHQDYNPVFDLRDPERQRIDPDELDALEDRDA